MGVNCYLSQTICAVLVRLERWCTPITRVLARQALKERVNFNDIHVALYCTSMLITSLALRPPAQRLWLAAVDHLMLAAGCWLSSNNELSALMTGVIGR